MITSEEALNAAVKAADWLAQYEENTDHGLAWRRTPEAQGDPHRNLYYGSGGIALYMLELYRTTKDERYKEKAIQAGRDIAHYVTTGKASKCGIYGGWPSFAFALAEIGQQCDMPELLEKAAFCLDEVRKEAVELGCGLGFIEEMPFGASRGLSGEREIYDLTVGSAGTALVLLHGVEQGYYPQGVEFAKLLCDRLLEVAEYVDGYPTWTVMSDMPYDFTSPNFAHGGAGVGFVMARLYQHTKEQKYLDAAISSARYLQKVAVPVGDGHLLHRLMEEDGHQFYLGICHGPPGTARTFRQLYDITGEQEWLDWSGGLTDGLLGLGAPEKRSDGLWNSVSQCCCDSGIGDHALYQYQATGDEKYLDLAKRVGAEILRRSEVDPDTGNLCWPQAEHRAMPDHIERQTGYMQGAAGVGSFLLHLATTMKGDPVKVWLPDMPLSYVINGSGEG